MPNTKTGPSTPWTEEETRDLYTFRCQETFLEHKAIGELLGGRTAQACRLRLLKLRRGQLGSAYQDLDLSKIVVTKKKAKAPKKKQRSAAGKAPKKQKKKTENLPSFSEFLKIVAQTGSVEDTMSSSSSPETESSSPSTVTEESSSSTSWTAIHVAPLTGQRAKEVANVDDTFTNDRVKEIEKHADPKIRDMIARFRSTKHVGPLIKGE